MSGSTLFDVDETLTVAQVHRRLSESIRRSFSAEIWVQGQIRNLSRSGRGHVYFDLCDPTPAGAPPKSSIAVTLFDSNRQIVNRIIARTGNSIRMDDGVEVRVRARVELYAPRGQLQLNMTSIDPEFTLGRLGADRDQLLRELKAENLLEANRARELPLVPLRIGLITSNGSAAHADFTEELAGSSYRFELELLSTRVQGEFAPQEIADMISGAARLGLDVLAIVRGGGARTDLAAFDTAPVARAIAHAPVPVLCGIGHEIDTSVADMVAHSSLKTPTACARFLIERVREFDDGLGLRAERLAQVARRLPDMHRASIDYRAVSIGERVSASLQSAESQTSAAASDIERRVSRSIAESERRLNAARGRLGAQARAALLSANRQCDRAVERVGARPQQVIRSQRSSLDLLEARLSAVDPTQALRRGYSITTTTDGALIRNATSVRAGDEIVTRLASGTVVSTVDRVGSPSEHQDNP